MIRPRLKSFRTTRVHAETAGFDVAPHEGSLSVRQDIRIVRKFPSDEADQPGARQQPTAIVRVQLLADITEKERLVEPQAEHAFELCYEGKFLYPESLEKEGFDALLDADEHQYLLVAQVFPLAMTRFRHQLQEFGMDVRELPLGV